jgi:hypothetical protein
MSTDRDLPTGFSFGEARPAGVGKVHVNVKQAGLQHFEAWGYAIDQALEGVSGPTDTEETRQLALTGTVRYYARADGEDPGWWVDYTATIM